MLKEHISSYKCSVAVLTFRYEIANFTHLLFLNVINLNYTYVVHMCSASEDFIDIRSTKTMIANISSSTTKLCYTTQIINDMIVEDNETFIAIISSTDPNVRLQKNISTVTIVDDGDCKLINQAL